MSEGGGFCEIHGPFDPPDTSCPYCAMESEQRHKFGPPEVTRPAVPQRVQGESAPDATLPDAANKPVEAPESAPAEAEPAPVEGDSQGFVRRTVEPDAVESAEVTTVAPRDVAFAPEPGDDDAASTPPPVGWLVVKQPLAQRGEILTLRPNQIIGREGDVRFPDPLLSRQHARLTFEPPDDTPGADPVFHLWPFGPTNPVYVNGEPIRGATPLSENDEIKLGNTLFVFKVLLD